MKLFQHSKPRDSLSSNFLLCNRNCLFRLIPKQLYCRRKHAFADTNELLVLQHLVSDSIPEKIIVLQPSSSRRENGREMWLYWSLLESTVPYPSNQPSLNQRSSKCCIPCNAVYPPVEGTERRGTRLLSSFARIFVSII